jgi:hypothetical protein
VERAYRSAIEAFEAALMDPSKGNDELELWWADPALTSAKGEVNSWAGFGQQLRFPDPSRRSLEILSVTIDGTSAELSSCFIDDGQLIDSATQRVLSDQVTTTTERVTLQRQASGWVVTERAQASQTMGVGSCASA